MPKIEPNPPETGREPRLTIWTDCTALGGIAEFNHSMAMGMRQRGYRVTVVAPQFGEIKKERERKIGIEHCEVQLPERQLRGIKVTDEAATASFLRDLAPDVVLFADGWEISNILAKKCAMDLSIPMVFSLGIVLGDSQAFANQSPVFKSVFEAAHSVVCISYHNAQLLKSYPIGSAEPKLIYYGRPENFFAPTNAPIRQEYRAKLGAGPDDAVFLTPARYDHIKGYDFFLTAFEHLRKEAIWPRLHFVWAGEGPLENPLRAALAERGLTDRVHLLGPRNDIDCWLDAADAFILPSRAEGMPLSIAEAMAKGVPVIATNVGGIPEQLGKYGMIIVANSTGKFPDSVAQGIYQTIHWIVANPEKRRELGRLGKARAEMLFREDRMVIDYARLIGAAGRNVPDKAKPHDYVSPGYAAVKPDNSFPNMIEGNTGECDWPYLRREIMHKWYVDRRAPNVGFLSRDEAAILHNAALPFADKPALEIGCFLGWSTCHLALAGVRLDVIDPLIANAQMRASIEASLRAAGTYERVNLVGGRSPEAVQALARDGKRWSLIFIDGDHADEAPRMDAAAAESFAAEDCVVMFHYLAAPEVANGLRYFRERGWKIRIYRTMQVMAAAWRGKIEPPVHEPDPSIAIPLPLHLADLVDTSAFPRLHAQCAAFTMTSIDGRFGLFQAVRHVVEHRIPGDIVECGVWRGGSMMLAALTLADLGATDRRLVLFDTFAGMTPPTEHDVHAASGRKAESILAAAPRNSDNHYWAIAPLDDVKRNMQSTHYPSERIEYVVGDVCRTVPESDRRPIALLRLDTDWYESTRCELEHLFDRLQPGGILMVDDYGHWQGSRRACDEFFAGKLERLHPISNDDTAYIAVKGAERLPEDFARRLVLI